MAIGSVLVTGDCGYIGSFTALSLIEADYEVVIVDNRYNAAEECLNRIQLSSGKRPVFYNVDISDELALDKVFEAHPDIDNVIHFAELKAVGQSSEIPLEYYRVNVHGTICLLQIMARHNVTNHLVRCEDFVLETEVQRLYSIAANAARASNDNAAVIETPPTELFIKRLSDIVAITSSSNHLFKKEADDSLKASMHEMLQSGKMHN